MRMMVRLNIAAADESLENIELRDASCFDLVIVCLFK